MGYRGYTNKRDEHMEAILPRPRQESEYHHIIINITGFRLIQINIQSPSNYLLNIQHTVFYSIFDTDII